MNRRDALRILGMAAVAGATLPAAAAEERRTDSRLLGTWRSDKERTIAHWCHLTETSLEKRRKLDGVFGKLTVRFTETNIESELDGVADSVSYSVVTSDASSVVVTYKGPLGSQELQHIHFEEDSYYVLVGYNVEFFKRVKA